MVIPEQGGLPSFLTLLSVTGLRVLLSPLAVSSPASNIPRLSAFSSRLITVLAPRFAALLFTESRTTREEKIVARSRARLLRFGRHRLRASRIHRDAPFRLRLRAAEYFFLSIMTFLSQRPLRLPFVRGYSRNLATGNSSSLSVLRRDAVLSDAAGNYVHVICQV